ncbi:F0F1 ATP synthase subunit alpha [Candidatus Peregrinibacteria bacterium]|nr:F0F1 ATP synthase subunit alpha [Candidatus Peregrinibacteria bacterium]
MAQETLHAFLDKIEEALKSSQTETKSSSKKQGVIESYKDGVIMVKGLPELKMGEVVTVEGTSTKALVMNLEKDTAYAVILQGGESVREGLFVIANNENLSIPVSDQVIGRVLSPLGEALDGGASIKSDKNNPIEKIAPGVINRKSVHQPVQTGIVAIDALIPIGRGQRELIIGDRQTGKTTVAIDTILNQKGQDMICIYTSIGQRESKTSQVLNTLRKNGALDYTTIISAPAASSAVMQFLAPFSAMAVAEHFMEQGKDVLVVFDDLSKHAVSYREMSLLLRRPPGREAYPGDVFYLHSRLLERAAKLNEENGGGSITALPIIETQAGDVSAYIPTNVISITDGQIFLEADLFYKGIRPAINVGISVSRVGGAAQTKIIKKVSGSVKLDLAQYYELEAFSQFASELDEATKAQLLRGKIVVEALKQKNGNPYKLWEEVAVLVASTGGYLDKYGESNVREKLQELLTYMEAHNEGLITKIETQKEYTDEIKAELKTIMEKVFNDQ